MTAQAKAGRSQIMLAERVEQLEAEYVDKYVVIDEECPELTRFMDMVGQVRAINFNGQALVEFDADNNRGRHDIGLDYLKVVDKPEPPPAKEKPAAKKAAAPSASKASGDKSGSAKPGDGKPDAELSPLEVARMKKAEVDVADNRKSDDKPMEMTDNKQ